MKHEVHITLGPSVVRVFNRSFDTLIVYYEVDGDYEMEILEAAEGTLVPTSSYPTSIVLGNVDNPHIRLDLLHPDQFPHELKLDLGEL